MKKVSVIVPKKPLIKPKIKVAAYARVSRESERMQHSLSAQISYYNELIQKNPDWEFAGVFADSFISGTDIKKRTEFQRLMQECSEGKIDIILCKSISRFARNTVDLLEAVRYLKSIDVEVRFEKERINTLSTDGELMLSVMAEFAELESKSISDNLKWAIRKKFEQGKQWHTAAYGYRWNGETFVVEEREAEAIKVIFQNYLNDVPIRQTSRWLKENGHAWTMPFIKYALQNEVYVGDVMLQKYFTESPVSKKLVKNTGQLQRYYISNNHEPIIDRETFDKVQAKIKANFEFNPSAHWIVKPYCFTSKIVCGKCGNHFYKGLTKTNMVDGLCEHYVCLGKHKKGLKFCNARGIRGNRLRAACCDVLGIDEFDENLFSKQIEKIVTTDTDVLEFYFYDGRMKTATIHYFSQEEKKHTDPHTKVFGYAWSSNGYQMITNECEAVKLMYQYYSEGAAIIEISRRLEAQGFKARTAISRKLITRVLDSDFYIGHRTIKGQFTESGEDEFIENDHEPLIDLELNRKVKERRREELKKFFNSRKKSAE